jgi:metallo-beta-lactamase family protein
LEQFHVKIHFLGANRQVTGSRYCLETVRSRVMIDCGMFQERQFEARNWRDCPVPADSIDAMVVTHAHIDHCGLIPRFVRQGFRSPIYATSATTDLLPIMLEDAAHIQEEDAAYKSKRHKREGRESRYPVQPLYVENDVIDTLRLIQSSQFGQPVSLTDDITVTFHRAGHILGSAMLEVKATENGAERTIVFSGDIGQWGKPIIHDPTRFESADYVIMESTYGDRLHEQNADISEQLARVINDTVLRGGKVIIPTFAVERAQEILYFVSLLLKGNRIPRIPVFLDSPMAVDVTDIFRKHNDEFDADTWNRINARDTPFHFPELQYCITPAQSKAVNRMDEPVIIMATSGMCTAGRIKHHLKHHVGDSRSTVLFVGYQSEGTLGRQILDRSPQVRIHGEMHPVRARIEQVAGFSGHADRDGLLYWVNGFKSKPRRLFLTHGDVEAAESLARDIRVQYKWDVLIPDYESTTDLK